eukprot:6452403-Lingulodinium_polyedra.AAC.1
MTPITARIEELRARQLSMRPPVSRIQSARQRRDRLRLEATKAQVALEEARQRLQLAQTEAARIQEGLKQAEAELVEAEASVVEGTHLAA